MHPICYCILFFPPNVFSMASMGGGGVAGEGGGGGANTRAVDVDFKCGVKCKKGKFCFK